MSSHGPSTYPTNVMYVRALYDYEADDQTSLSFHEGDIIQVINQLESGWWDGIINGVRGWFPSNYCQEVSSLDDLPTSDSEGGEEGDDATEMYEENFEGDDEGDADSGPNGAGDDSFDEQLEQPRAGFWIPQATPDGQLFYYNMMTGERRTELPLESPASSDSGPYDRTRTPIPTRTRVPPELMAQGFMHEEDYESTQNSSELESDHYSANRFSRPSVRRNRSHMDTLSPSTSMDSIGGISPLLQTRNEGFNNLSATQSHIASSTSFTAATYDLPTTATLLRSFFDDGVTAPLTWGRITHDMKSSLDRFRDAINEGRRAEYVQLAEDVSDNLRLLLAAGSGTTDNHSGQPSIISQNKALYPHFRDMMSKFSKLVISSHIASADWPNPESIQKCLLEAEGVFQGVCNYVEVAKQQRGEEIPRLFPGFVIGSTTGGNWQNNGLGLKDPIAYNFLEDDDGAVEPNAILDSRLMETMEEHRRHIVLALRDLEKYLSLPDGAVFITALFHETISNNVCNTAARVLDAFRSWSALVESIDLSILGNGMMTPQLAEFSTHKQSLYDNVSDLIIACQAVAGPLADEWAHIRGEPLDRRLEYGGQCSRALEANIGHVTSALQRLCEQVHMTLLTNPDLRAQRLRKDVSGNRRKDDSFASFDANDNSASGVSSNSGNRNGSESRQASASGPSDGRAGGTSNGSHAPKRPPIMVSQSFTEGEFHGTHKGNLDKVKKIFGEDPTAQAPHFLRLDHADDIVWENKTETPTVRGGTLRALVEQLTRHDQLQSNFNSTFLLTYTSFTTASELFRLLVERFSMQPPEGLTVAQYDTWRDMKQKIVRMRIVNILRSWLDNYWMEDYKQEETKKLLREMEKFTNETIKAAEVPGYGPLKPIIEQRVNGKERAGKILVPSQSQNIPSSIVPKNMKKLKFLDIDALEFARQLTLIESRLYGQIKPSECINKTWQKKVSEGDPEPAPNVKALILHSNQMTNWVAEMILSQMDLRKRVLVIKHFVNVADKCRTLNNFSTLTSIISALGTAPITRLKRTWDQVPPRTRTTLENMRKLMGNSRNFREYRDTLRQASPPCIPFFGVYLTDLTFIEDGIPSVIRKTNLINFFKRAKTADIIRDIQQYQNVPYALHTVDGLKDYILGHMHMAGDVHEMYSKSLQVEPREREDEKITRVLSESGFM